MNKEMINEQIKELGLEFWGILHFETDINYLYNYLDIDKLCLGMSTFINWVVLPELIPPDVRSQIRLKLLNRNEDSAYECIPSDLLTAEDTLYQEQVTEWLHYKYQAHNATEQRFHHLYKMKKQALIHFLHSLSKFGYSTDDTNLRYFSYYQTIPGESYDQ